MQDNGSTFVTMGNFRIIGGKLFIVKSEVFYEIKSTAPS